MDANEWTVYTTGVNSLGTGKSSGSSLIYIHSCQE